MMVMHQRAQGVLEFGGLVSVVSEFWRMVGTELEEGRGLILDWMGSWQSDRDLDNLTVSPH